MNPRILESWNPFFQQIGRKIKNYSLLSAVVFLLSVFPAFPCFGEKIPVAASIFPVADMVKQVGGDYVEVFSVIPPGASPHTYEPKPSVMKKISSVKVFFMIGAGLEYWNEKFFKNTGGRLIKIVLSDGVDLIHGKAHHHVEKAGKPHSEDSFANPHIWLDVEIAKSMVKRIVTALASLDNRHAPYYEERGNKYIAELDRLDKIIYNETGKFKTKKYVSFHPAWEYFARRYGLESAGVIESVPGKSPTPLEIKRIVEDIKIHGVKAVFAEPQFNPKVAEVIAKEAEINVLMLDPMGGPGINERESYIDIMKYNLKILREAML
ncbi:MAG: metal ABC transporter substrate-binding protein [Proteobacteria bacterium]|nr:metal ABC transporter substrate-binding protein [Pseudomonadota bacterium]